VRADVDARQYQIDQQLAEGRERWGIWEEWLPYGAVIRCSLNGEHLRRVLQARRQVPVQAAM